MLVKTLCNIILLITLFIQTGAAGTQNATTGAGGTQNATTGAGGTQNATTGAAAASIQSKGAGGVQIQPQECDATKSYQAATTFGYTLETETRLLPEGEAVKVTVAPSLQKQNKTIKCAWLIDYPVTLDANNIQGVKVVMVGAQITRDPEDAEKAKTRLTLSLPDTDKKTNFWDRYKRKLLLVSTEEDTNPVVLRKIVIVSNSNFGSMFASIIALLLTLFAYVIAVRSLGRIGKVPANNGKANNGKANNGKANNGKANNGKEYYCWFNPVYLTSNTMDNASISQFQAFCFTLLVFFLLAYYLLRFGSLSNISTSLMLLLGTSGGSAILSKFINKAKNRLSADNWAWVRARGWLTVYEDGYGSPKQRVEQQAKNEQHIKWGDLLKTGESFDIYKFQVAIFSIVVALGALGLIIADPSQLSSFEVPENLLYLLGLGNGIYLLGKLAAPESYSDLDKQLNEARTTEEKLLGKAKAESKSSKDELKNLLPEYNDYISKARLAAEMLKAVFCGEGDTKFGDKIDDDDLMPLIPGST